MDIIQTSVTTGCIGSTFCQPPKGAGQWWNPPDTDNRALHFLPCFFGHFHLRRGKTCRLWLYFQWSHWGTGCACHHGRRSYDGDIYGNFRGLSCFPLDTELQKRAKKKRDQHRSLFVKIWKLYVLWSVPLPRSPFTLNFFGGGWNNSCAGVNYGSAVLVTIPQETEESWFHRVCCVLLCPRSTRLNIEIIGGKIAISTWKQVFPVTVFWSTSLIASKHISTKLQFKQTWLISLEVLQLPHKRKFKIWMCHVCLFSIIHSENTKAYCLPRYCLSSPSFVSCFAPDTLNKWANWWIFFCSITGTRHKSKVIKECISFKKGSKTQIKWNKVKLEKM